MIGLVRQPSHYWLFPTRWLPVLPVTPSVMQAHYYDAINRDVARRPLARAGTMLFGLSVQNSKQNKPLLAPNLRYFIIVIENRLLQRLFLRQLNENEQQPLFLNKNHNTIF
jgi:hypothetical protein